MAFSSARDNRSIIEPGLQRSTIMFDGEDIDAFIEAFQEIKKAI